ncbi:hypothetical protein AC579_2868 [Pseudocercospora musae]|uniref:Uncharacterized protein n=1 Tax=Pseudocercospora musae TaxID=113226 RepID=A0A139IUQ9_9PEZI|nr:hypothetical protein AC579_2868 [Pseudocercospora musae]
MTAKMKISTKMIARTPRRGNAPTLWTYSSLQITTTLDFVRNAVIEHFQIRMLQSQPKQHTMFSTQEACAMFEDLPSTSTLYRFALDMSAFLDAPSPLTIASISNYAELPAPALAAITTKAHFSSVRENIAVNFKRASLAIRAYIQV